MVGGESALISLLVWLIWCCSGYCLRFSSVNFYAYKLTREKKFKRHYRQHGREIVDK